MKFISLCVPFIAGEQHRTDHGLADAKLAHSGERVVVKIKFQKSGLIAVYAIQTSESIMKIIYEWYRGFVSKPGVTGHAYFDCRKSASRDSA